MSASARCDQLPIDALAGAFLQLARYDNVNTNQIIIVAGAIEAERLRAAVQRAIASFPLLLARPMNGGRIVTRDSFQPGEVGLEVHAYHARCDFADPSFRQLLMSFSNRARIDWRRRIPIQAWLVVAADRTSSCLYVNTSHAVADAKSDCLLLARIMTEYVRQTAPAAGGMEICDTVHDFEPLQQIRPEWYRLGRRLGRRLATLVSIARDLTHGDQGFPVNPTDDTPAHAVDFYHSVLPPGLQRRLHRAAGRHGVTINTLFCAALVRTIERLSRVRRGWASVVCAVSLRRLIDPKFADSFRNFLVASRLRLPLGARTALLLTAVTQEVERVRGSDIERETGRLEWLEALLRWRWLRPLTRWLLARSMGTNACYSNPGVIEEDLSCFGDPSLPTLQYAGFGCLVHPFDFILYTPTVEGRLQLDLIYRKSRFADIETDFVMSYREELSRLLAELEGAGEMEERSYPDEHATSISRVAAAPLARESL